MMPMTTPWSMPFGGLAVLVIVVLGVAFAVAIAASVNRSSSAAHPTAEDLLRMRYARGEIDTEEYQQRLAALSASLGR
jgi:putative membrane protein